MAVHIVFAAIIREVVSALESKHPPLKTYMQDRQFSAFLQCPIIEVIEV